MKKKAKVNWHRVWNIYHAWLEKRGASDAWDNHEMKIESLVEANFFSHKPKKVKGRKK